jgi:hypothetical protein
LFSPKTIFTQDSFHPKTVFAQDCSLPRQYSIKTSYFWLLQKDLSIYIFFSKASIEIPYSFNSNYGRYTAQKWTLGFYIPPSQHTMPSVHNSGSALTLHWSWAVIPGAGLVNIFNILSNPQFITEELGWYLDGGGILNICGNTAHLPHNGDFKTWVSNLLRTLEGNPLWTKADPER